MKAQLAAHLTHSSDGAFSPRSLIGSPWLFGLWLTMLCSQAVSATSADLVDLLSTPNQAIALSPDGEALLVSYHPGRLSLLGLIDRDSSEFTLLYATPQRVEFEARFVEGNRLWLFTRREEGCSFDQSQSLLEISLPQARRHQAIQLSGRHGLKRSGTLRLSLNDRANQRIRQLTAQWGLVEHLNWAAVRVQNLPEQHCPSHWASDYLVLEAKDLSRHLYRPDRPGDLMLSGRQWLIDDQRQVHAQLDPGGLLYRPGNAPLRLDGADDWQLLGLNRNAQILMLGPGLAPSAPKALYRIDDSGLELLFQPNKYQIDPARTLMLNQQAVAISGEAEHDPRLLLDAKHSHWIRHIEAELGPIRRIIGQSSNQTIRAVTTDSGFWVTEQGRPAQLLESAHPWFIRSGVSAPKIRSLWAATDEILPSELQALQSRGIDATVVTDPVATFGPGDCVWSRRQVDRATSTHIQCGARQQRWVGPLSEERDDERAARLGEMISFMTLGSSEP